ncbi:Bug family tripartite tricarboxylate transporter substrate binding protein [Glaciimonas immobilis]|uniref:Tripartite-type tricarboxylate transporter receptor subunit TctC n=1 Tax=Glaciimonas immobilis TaxID=728004 RepID=A0A840RW86_9BURK|nr:tripartite tricarboxylate transporter substrate binding protein [Glaciimonas immobilis]KAF3996505.1 tripartite tricarboxylate transporter substrate binding protein [Glaciimonas immobilis]MBB5201136.1 tripartite-type tricarboxylate transporter receptor subunit TctC [Glaciimonas immobilis]
MTDTKLASLQRRRLIQSAAVAFPGLLLGVGPALARSPDALIKILVGFPPGGSGDTFARIFGSALREEMGNSIVIDNKPGAGGMTVALVFLRAAKDGSELMLATGSTAISAPISHAKPPYNAVTDFQWLGLLSNAPFVIAVNPSLPVTDLKGLVAYAKAHPNKLSYGHAGLGTTVHLAAELFKSMAGIDVADIAYNGSAGAIVGALSGEVQFVVETSGTLLPYHKSGKLRIITSMAEVREKNIPNIPTAREAGYDLLAGTANLLAAPLGTPQSVIEPISLAIGRAMARPKLQAQLLQLGIEPVLKTSPAQAQAFVAAEVARWTPLVKKLGIAL